MTVQFVGLDNNEGVIASDTRTVRPDGSIYDDFTRAKVYRFNPRLLAVFSGQVGAIKRLVYELAWVDRLTPQKIAGHLMARCSHATGQERLDASILGDENGEMVIYRVTGHIDIENPIPYEVCGPGSSRNPGSRDKKSRPAEREALYFPLGGVERQHWQPIRPHDRLPRSDDGKSKFIITYFSYNR